MRKLLFLTLVLMVPVRPVFAQNAELVIEWNRLLQLTVFIPGQQPPTVGAQRSYAMMHVAMFDAANAIADTYVPYHTLVKASHGASSEAAVAQAAHDVLVALYPSQQSVYDEALAADLAEIPSGLARQGALVGAAVAQQILALRTGDGWDTLPPVYVLPSTPGNWQPTPPALGCRDVHAHGERYALCGRRPHALPPAAAAGPDQRAIRRRFRRGEDDRIGQ